MKGPNKIHIAKLEHSDNTVYRENFTPVLFSPFSPSGLRANFKLGQLNGIKNYIRKLECGRIQDWANQSVVLIGQK